MHKEAKLTLPQKGQMSMYNHYFSNCGSPLIPDDMCKDSATRHARFWRRRFLKVFPIQKHREANDLAVKKVKCQRTTNLITTLVDLLSLMILAKIQPQGILGYGEDF